MNAQDIIDAPDRQDELMSLFYPDLWAQQKADENITAVLNRGWANA